MLETLFKAALHISWYVQRISDIHFHPPFTPAIWRQFGAAVATCQMHLVFFSLGKPPSLFLPSATGLKRGTTGSSASMFPESCFGEHRQIIEKGNSPPSPTNTYVPPCLPNSTLHAASCPMLLFRRKCCSMGGIMLIDMHVRCVLCNSGYSKIK